MHSAVIDGYLAAGAAPTFEPRRRMLHPVFVVAVGEIFVRVGAAAFFAVVGAFHRADGLRHQIVEFERFDQVGVPDQAAVADRNVGHPFVDLLHQLDTFSLQRGVAEYGAMFLHRTLHVDADFGGR